MMNHATNSILRELRLRVRKAVAARRGARGPRRGVALLLVLIALGAAGAVTTFYLASRDNSGAIGENAERNARSEWAARSAAEFATASLQTTVDWRSLIADDCLLASNMEVSGGKATVVVTNLLGKVPGPADVDLLVTVVSRVDGVVSTAQRVVRVTPDVELEDAIDPLLNEFGLYALNNLTVNAGASVGVWSASPAAIAGRFNKIGVGFTEGSGMNIGSPTAVSSSRLYVRNDASVGLKDFTDNAAFIGGEELPVHVPVAAARLPSGFDSLAVRSVIDRTISGGPSSTTLQPGMHEGLTVRSSAVVTLDTGDYSFDDLEINSQGVLRINGPVRVHVRSDMDVIDRGAIELADKDSFVIFFLSGDLEINDSGVGVARDIARDSSRSVNSITEYETPARVLFLGLHEADDAASEPTYHIRSDALVLGSFHAPTAEVRLSSRGALIGRATASSIDVRNNTVFLYDPTFDRNIGFTSKYSPLYTIDGDPIAGLASAISAFDPSAGIEALRPSLIAGVTLIEAGSLEEATVTLGHTITPRSSRRAQGEDWPMRARAMERFNITNLSRMLSGSAILIEADIELGINGGIDVSLASESLEPSTQSTLVGGTINLLEATIEAGGSVLDGLGGGVDSVLGGLGGVLGLD
ncbi:MAG: hypothetical protein EA376_14355 [Phycisphaeraceae bacterium]|nr:MAG: hypothetical protein EA376_14355 [Phycisphaeraceae bacterium]